MNPLSMVAGGGIGLSGGSSGPAYGGTSNTGTQSFGDVISRTTTLGGVDFGGSGSGLTSTMVLGAAALISAFIVFGG